MVSSDHVRDVRVSGCVIELQLRADHLSSHSLRIASMCCGTAEVALLKVKSCCRIKHSGAVQVGGSSNPESLDPRSFRCEGGLASRRSSFCTMSFIKVNAAGRHISANLFARRALHQSSYSYNSTPEWEQLVGGRAGVERQRQRYESKYSNLIEQKAQEKGLTTEQYKQLKIEQQARVDKAAQLKLRPNAHAQGSPSPVEAGSEMQRSTGEQSTSQPKVVRPPPSAAQTASKPKPPPPSTRDNPVKVSFDSRG